MREEKLKKEVGIKDFSLEEKSRIVRLFTWLITQDKKQNPASYKIRANR
jgi:hypothetical protein